MLDLTEKYLKTRCKPIESTSNRWLHCQVIAIPPIIASHINRKKTMHPLLILTAKIRNRLVVPNLILSMYPRVSAEYIGHAKDDIARLVQYIEEIETYAKKESLQANEIKALSNSKKRLKK